ncbi:MAG: hypothetical protein E8D46_10815 [Nitrospira sp.]|nr:MAG: hypothetical protein E8D46_10815 [Nitrospira sp.]
MNTDVAGRVRNVQLPTSKPLLPLFEAIINSIQAIEDAKEKRQEIKVTIIRDKSALFSLTDQHLADIVGFVVLDNGVGFDEANFEAFTTSDTTFKASRGGKGVGCFMWLAAFDEVTINSVFAQDEKKSRRRFTFCAKGSGIEKHSITDADGAALVTSLSLIGFKEKYRRQCPKRLETIAAHIVEEFLDYFLGPSCPSIILHDQATEETLVLDDFYDRTMGVQSDVKKLLIQGNPFDVVHVKLYSNHISEHRLYLCAHNRAVTKERLTGIPNMARRLADEEGNEFVYAAYVNSVVLDDAVNADRTGFSLCEDGSNLYASEFTLADIRESIHRHCEEFLSPYTAPIAGRKREKVQRFIQGEGAMYRPILNRLEKTIHEIDPEATDDEIDRHLYDAYHKIQVDLREEGRKLLDSPPPQEVEFESFRRRFDDFLEKTTEINRSDLARYVIHRKAIIEFLQKQLSMEAGGKYKPEERIHSIIFPQGKSSDDVLFEDHNLWLVDERLAFHVCLNSDQQIKRSRVLENKSKKEPDILIFDKAIAFTETSELPFTSITIVEFKRPLRDDYSEKENPFVQVYKYIEEIRAGKAKSITGRPIPIQNNMPFYCYIICDLTPRLKEWARNFNLKPTPDGLGFFGYNENYGAYCEVVSYSKLIADAQKRNQAFFRKIGFPA